MLQTRVFICLFITLLIAGKAKSQEQEVGMSMVKVFENGENGYHTFRIPAVLSLGKGVLLAFSEGRKGGRSDTGDIDLVMKRSSDHGASWGSLEVIWDDEGNTCGNPAPVLDKTTNEIHLLLTWNLGGDAESEIIDQTSEDTRRVYVMSSSDYGVSWQDPREITSDVKLDSWTWYATGPGSGIAMNGDEYRGRLMVACDHIEADTKKYYSHVIFSDDHGDTWQLGGSTPLDQVNECEVAELPGGMLMLNMRNYDRQIKHRQTAISRDGGLTWTEQRHDKTLIEPICQASLLAYPDYGLLLFSNPASEKSRENMTLRFSSDWGYSWASSLVLHSGPSAYSDLVILSHSEVGCLFEGGNESPYENIYFAKISLGR